MKALLLSLAVLTTPATVPAQIAPAPPVSRPLASSSDIMALEKLNAEWLNAYKTHDGLALERILADDFEAIYPGGRVMKKTDLVKAAINPSRIVETIAWEDLKIMVFGDTAIVRARSRMSGKTAEAPFSGVNDYADIYARRDGVWRAISAHVVKVE